MRNSLQSLTAALCLLAGVAHGQVQNALPLDLLTDQAQSPSYLADPGDGRLFIVERAGRVRIFANGTLQLPNDAFLDIQGLVDLADPRQSDEGGMHSIAFDPNFATNHYVFVEYTRPGPDPSPLETVIARYTALTADPNHADPASAHIVLILASPQGQEFNIHKGGQLQFGPDGFLYFAWGDGGSQDNPSCGAQEHDVLFGKMIRIDPNGDDFPADPNRNYAIPATNPFADPNDGILDEIWASGFRNPYRFSFDRLTHDLWIGDVGGTDREEIDMDVASNPGGPGRGKNYGWKVLEGNTCHTAIPDASCEAYVKPCGDPGYTAPLVDFPHDGGGGAIIGGYVYRGATKSWRGRYIFADFDRGEIYALTDDGGTPGRVVLFSGDPFGFVSFGEDHNGELYVLDIGNNTVSRLRFDLIGQSKQQDACVSRLNDVFARTTSSRSSQVRSCVDRAARGELAIDETLDVCVDGDPKGKFAKVRLKTEALDTALCSAPAPEFGYAGAYAGIAAALLSETELARDVFGDVLGTGVIPKATDELAAGCQKAVLGALASCQKARRSEFVSCENLGLKKNTLGSSLVLATCLSSDPKARIAKACDPLTGKIATKAIANSCTAKGVDLSTAFPGCAVATAPELASCLDHAGCLRNCELFDAADALGADCTAFCPP